MVSEQLDKLAEKIHGKEKGREGKQAERAERKGEVRKEYGRGRKDTRNKEKEECRR